MVHNILCVAPFCCTFTLVTSIQKSHLTSLSFSYFCLPTTLQIIAWAEVRDDSNPIDWLLAGYHGKSKTEITVLAKGYGGLEECANILPDAEPVFGGVKLSNGKFVHFFYADEGTSVMKKGRASMHKNGKICMMYSFVICKYYCSSLNTAFLFLDILHV